MRCDTQCVCAVRRPAAGSAALEQGGWQRRHRARGSPCAGGRGAARRAGGRPACGRRAGVGVWGVGGRGREGGAAAARRERPRGTSAECARAVRTFLRAARRAGQGAVRRRAHTRVVPRTAGETHLRHGVAWDDRGGARDRRPRGARAVAAARGAATRARHRRAETLSSAWPR